MKRLLFATIFVFTSIIANAQTRLAVSFADFEAWTKQIRITGYPFMQCEQDDAGYTAMLASNPAKVLQVKLTDISKFDEYKMYKMLEKDVVPYTWNGYKAVNFFFADVTFLVLALPEAEVTVTIGLGGKVTKAALEQLAAKTNLQNIRPSKAGANTPGIKWPASIPNDMQISNAESIQSLGSDGTFKDVIEVKARMSPELISSCESITRRYKGDLSSVETLKLIFMCEEAEEMNQLKTNFKKGEYVKFLYYIK